jgi:hypothetical protein
MPPTSNHATAEPAQAIRLGTLRRFARSISVDYLPDDRTYLLGLLGLDGPGPEPLGQVTPGSEDYPDGEWTDLAKSIGIVGGSRFQLGVLRALRAIDAAVQDSEPVGPTHGFRPHRDCPYPIVMEEL